MHDVNEFETYLSILTMNGEKSISELLKKMSSYADALTANPLDLEGNKAINEGKIFLSKNIKIDSTDVNKTTFLTELESVLSLGEKENRKVAKKIGSAILPLFESEIKSARVKKDFAQKQMSDSLDLMELWSKREKETAEYPSFVQKQEEEWLLKEKEANEQALCEMRKYVPANISQMTVEELHKEVKALGGIYSLELATEIKNNKLLHWLVMHPDDIAFANFLVGDKKVANKHYLDNTIPYHTILYHTIPWCSTD